jgi:hypothetical protein
VPGYYLKRARRPEEQHLPLAQYFLRVGGVLLALLLALDAYLPKLPVADREYADLPVIRIHSERKWPERIVFDTSLPASVPARIASSGPVTAPPETTSDASGKANGREAFARMQPSDAKLSQPTNPKKRESKLQHKSRITRKYTPSHYTSAPQWQLGWYGQGLWRGG